MSILSNAEEIQETQETQTEQNETEQNETQQITESQSETQETQPTAENSADWLPEEYRNDASFSKFKDVGSLAKSYKELQSHLGKKSSAIPGENASDEEWQSFYKSLGVPESADDYKFETDEELKLPDSLINDEVMKTYRDAFKDVNLTPKQAQALWAVRNSYLASEIAEAKEKHENMVKEAQATLRQEWGDNYDAEINKAIQAFKYLVPDTRVEDFPLTRDINFVRILNKVHSLIGDDKIITTKNSANTLSAIESEIADILKNPAYKNASDPAHDSLVDRMLQLHNQKAKIKE